MRAMASSLPSSIRHSTGGSSGWRHRSQRQTLGSGLLIGCGVALSLALALVLVHFSALAVVGVALVPPVVWLLSRSYGGLVLGLLLVLTVPYWHTFGSAQFTTLRLASFAAATTLLVTRRVALHRIDLALLLFVLVLVAGWLLQYDQPHAGRVLSTELTPIGFYLGARALPKERVQLVFRVAIYAGTAGALTVIYEYLRHHAVFVSPVHYDWNAAATGQYIFRPGGVYGSPPGASTVMAFVILFGLAGLTVERGRTKVASAFCACVCAIALVLTFTRAGMIAAAVGVLVFLWLIRSPLLRPIRVAWAVMAMIALLVVLLPKLETTTTFQNGLLRGGTLATRESYWSIALPVAASSPHTLLFGIGTGALETPLIASNALVHGDLAIAPQLFSNSLHSEYVTILVEQGLVGLAALILFFAVTGVAIAREARKARDPVRAALAASIVAFAIIMSVDTAFVNGPSFSMLMLASGLAANLMCAGRAAHTPWPLTE